ncbi:MAG: histidine kinase dimerization/phospho-acceptor domain-containing protein [Eubacterium sp.]
MNKEKQSLRSLFRARRSEHRVFISLNVKLMTTIVLAALLTMGTLVLLNVFETTIGNQFFLSKTVKTHFVNDRYRDLHRYIKKGNVRAKDAEALKKWIGNEKNTAILVYNSKGNVYSSGWAVDSKGTILSDVGSVGSSRTSAGAQNSQQENGSQPQVKDPDLKVNTSDFKEDLYNRRVRFEDGTYYVYINVYPERAWHRIMSILEIILAGLVFFVVVLKYNKYVMRRVINLSDDVSRIAEGDLHHQVGMAQNDELGMLSVNVDRMRTAILEKMENEQAAQKANQELITSMSHDIRTPLTSLIGYLDIIEGKKYESLEEVRQYIDSCRDKAFQLKDLSDKLFQYFLVFRDEQDDMDMEVLDAGILFQQMLGEHVSELESYGYNVNLQYNIPEHVMTETDVSCVHRIFDNLFSNMMKYASEKFPIEVKGSLIQHKVKLVFQNHIREEAKKVESTKIGVKTCQRLVQDLHGSFHVMEEEKIYTTEILFPVIPPSQQAAAAKEAEQKELVERVEAVQEAQEKEEQEELVENGQESNSREKGDSQNHGDAQGEVFKDPGSDL